jgi:cyclic pyranopterin phosphate synthase
VYLRLSVTDACDFRCWYCRPEGGGRSASPPAGRLEADDLLTLVDTINAAAPLTKVRITGGEPLLREDLTTIVGGIRDLLPDVELAITTNGHHLAEHAMDLAEAGLDRINISLDSLDPAVFRHITGVDGLNRVRRGVRAGQEAGFEGLKLNAVLLRSGSGAELEKLVAFAAREGLGIRFIELMPSGVAASLYREEYLSSADALEKLRAVGGDRGPLPSSGTAVRHLFERHGNEVVVGFIETVSSPFCDSCDRLRLDARGRLRGCLRREEVTDLGALLPRGRAVIVAAVCTSIAGKRGPDGGWHTTPMVQIGG